MAIKEFKNSATEDIANEITSKKSLKLLPVHLHSIAYKRLIFLDHANQLKDLLIWPSLRLEKLSGDRKEQHSIRINSQYRICFRWALNNTYEVEIIDYH